MELTAEEAAELDEAGNATSEREVIFEKMSPLPKGQKPPPIDPTNGIFPGCVRTVKQLIGRRTRHGEYEYEVKWGNPDMTSMDNDKNLYVPKMVLEASGFLRCGNRTSSTRVEGRQNQSPVSLAP